MTQRPVPSPAPVQGDISWFTRDRFGLFLVWGVYSLLGRHEWVKNHEAIDDEKYDSYLPYFDPDLYDPRDWARRAREAGMKYFLFTTKHHDGFCMYDSKYTDYKITNTPAKRDVLRQLVDAFRAEGLKVGLYYSLIDWHHPHFPIDRYHPKAKHMTLEEIKEANRSRNMAIYREYLQNQVRELMTNYGEVSYVFFDFSYPDADSRGVPGKGREDWGSEELVKLVRSLQPNILINDRLNLPLDQPDLHTPEQTQPLDWVTKDGKPVYWETCQTFSGSWGYHRDEMTWKNPEQLIKMLINSVSCGGNLIMNVGPTSRGTFDYRAKAALQVYADWMALHSRSIYGCTMSGFQAPTDCRYTQNGNRLYLHIYSWPFKKIVLPGLAGKIAYAQLLNDGSEILRQELPETEDAALLLPVVKPNVIVPVIEIFLK